ncbi:macro domain protein [Porphyromonas catoniae F0037]|jgi:hypothetical protein|uniref:Macro domain protein n=1 Tax=Porphyromonas catoniae F0037 TaxID=1127696 RepID=L1NIV1_9PORP|nr:macro domain-containing protein [Porphyromonas catoniae]EKY03195.1 macro domain protein [Porphyromonas catoniae F0037]
MSNISIREGSIFDSLYNKDVQTIVNTVNCAGVMGKGIALVYKLFYPDMFPLYKKFCGDKSLTIGKLWLYRTDSPNLAWVLNFPTKREWKNPSQMAYIELGLQKFLDRYEEKGITSIAFPMLGTANGGLRTDEVLSLMVHYLSQCRIPVVIYQYAPGKPDLYCEHFKRCWGALSHNEKKAYTRQDNRTELIDAAVKSGRLNTLLDILELKGVGLGTLEKCIRGILFSEGNSTPDLGLILD